MLAYLLISWAMIHPCAPNPTAVQLWEEGIHAYDQKHYEQALQSFTQLSDEGWDQGWISYNRGNSALRATHLGQAIAAYLQALHMMPRQSYLRANLEFARRHVQDAIHPPEPQTWLRTLCFWHYTLSHDELRLISSVAWILCWGFFIAAYYVRYRLWLRSMGYVCAIVSLFTVTSWLLHVYAPRRLAIILPEETEVRTSTEANALVRFKLHSGTEAYLIDRSHGWVLIELSDGKQGWVTELSIAEVLL